MPTEALADVPPTLPTVDIGHRSRAIDAVLCDAIIAAANTTLSEGLRVENEAWGKICETKDMRIGIDTFLSEGPRGKAAFVHE